jgi:septal ring factor EnvC (AmiA/AmiB activator)
MNKNDLKEIKTVIDSAFEKQLAKLHKKIDSTMERHLGSVHEEITELRTDMDTKFTAVAERMDRLGAKIDHINEKLGGFENREVDKRLQLEVRVGRLEKQRS